MYARDTRHRRMQEVNSVCTNGIADRFGRILYSTQYSLLVKNKLYALQLAPSRL